MQQHLRHCSRYTRWLSGAMLALLLFLFHSENLNAEGTAQVMPNAANGTALQVRSGIGSGPYRGAPVENRLKISILDNTIENIYFGLHARERGGTAPATDGFYRIIDPAGNVVVAATPIPTAGVGFITNYARAVAGPNIGGATPTGYTPILFDPTMNGDYYIELYPGTNAGATLSPNEIYFPFFDFTVARTNNTKYPGRLNCQRWKFITFDPADPNFEPGIGSSFDGDYLCLYDR